MHRDQLGGDDINASEGDKGLSEAVAVGVERDSFESHFTSRPSRI